MTAYPPILGHNGEHRPRFGLWLIDSPECRHAIQGILAEGFDCDVVLKFGARCRNHSAEPFRPAMPLSRFVELDPRLVDLPGCSLDFGPLDDGTKFGCYVREVFFPEHLNLRRR